VAEAASVADAAEQACAVAGVAPSEVSYLELAADGSSATDEAEIRGVAAAYPGKSGTARGTAVGTAKSSVGHTGYASGAAALIKTALCLHHRYLPVTPRFAAPKSHLTSEWEKSSLYVCDSSRAWFANEGGTRRAAVSGVSATAPGSNFHIVLSDRAGSYETENVVSLDAAAPKLLLFGAASVPALSEALAASLAAATAKKGAEQTEFARLLLATVEAEAAGTPGSYPLRLCLVASAATLTKELERAAKGVSTAAATGRDYASPAGSFFTPKPLASSNVAFMYGDGSSPYVGLGKDVHRIAPSLHEFVQKTTTAMWSEKHDTWNPRAIQKAAMGDEGSTFEKRTVDMFRAGVFYSVCFTHVARELLRITPTAAFGLSMGEAAMFFAFDEANSKKSDAMLKNLDSSPVWTEKLSIRFDALRAAWNIPADAPVSSFWAGFAVQAPRDQILAMIDQMGAAADCVRLVIVNDSKTCIVGGKPEQCEALIKRLGCGAMKIEQGMAGHCKEVGPYVGDIAEIHSMLRLPQGPAAAGVTFYSSSSGTVTPVSALANQSTGQIVANIYRNVADFPRLVETVHDAGTKIFVELGAGDLRAAATSEVLGGKSRVVSTAFDRRGADAWKQVLKMAATLISHGETGCQVSPLYHSKLIDELSAVANPDQKKKGWAKAKAIRSIIRRVEINGRYVGMSQGSGVIKSSGANKPDSRFLEHLRRIPTSQLELSTLGSRRSSTNKSMASMGSLGSNASLAE